jgi:hypothetical protein
LIIVCFFTLIRKFYTSKVKYANGLFKTIVCSFLYPYKDKMLEHAICELKCYKVMGTLWRHPRPKLKNLVKICAGFVNRRKNNCRNIKFKITRTRLSNDFKSFCLFLLRPSLYISGRSSTRIRTRIHSPTLSVNV